LKSITTGEIIIDHLCKSIHNQTTLVSVHKHEVTEPKSSTAIGVSSTFHLPFQSSTAVLCTCSIQIFMQRRQKTFVLPMPVAGGLRSTLVFYCFLCRLFV